MPRRLRVRFRGNRAPLRSAKEGKQAKDVSVWFYSDSAKNPPQFDGSRYRDSAAVRSGRRSL